MATLDGRQSYLACAGERDNNMEKLFYAVKAIGWACCWICEAHNR